MKLRKMTMNERLEDIEKELEYVKLTLAVALDMIGGLAQKLRNLEEKKIPHSEKPFDHRN